MTSRKKRTTPTKKHKARINRQRQREEEEIQNTSLKLFVEEEEWECGIDVYSINVERDGRPVEEEQDDIFISKRRIGVRR